MTRQERWILLIVALLVFGGLIARAWWRMHPPTALPPLPAQADPAARTVGTP